MKKNNNLKFDKNKNWNYINKIRNQEKLPAFLEQVLIGILLGDGHLQKASSGFKANARLKITFAERYKPLAFYITGLFCYFVNPKGISFSKVKSGKDSGLYGRISLTTVSNPVFKLYHDLFYKPVYLHQNIKYVKIIPLNIEELLTEVSLAFLLAGDGNYNKIKKVVRICTNSFTKEEVELLSKAIYNKFGIETRLEHTKNNQYILIVRTSQVPILQ